MARFIIDVAVDNASDVLGEVRAAERWLDEHPETDDHVIFGEAPTYGRPWVELAQDATVVRITDDDTASNVHQAASLVQWLLGKPGAPSHVFFEWSDEDEDGYYGGSAYVTAAGFVTHRTDHWVELMRAEHRVQVAGRHGGGPAPSGPIWLDDPRQFARLIAECQAAGVFAYAQSEDGPWRDLLDAMDIDVIDAQDVIDRALVPTSHVFGCVLGYSRAP